MSSPVSLGSRLLTGAIQDATIPAIATLFINNGQWSWKIFLIALACVYGFLFILWVNGSAWGWLWWLAFRRKQFTSAALKFLKTNKFPEPEEWEINGAVDYFERIVADGDCNPELRIMAGKELGSLDVLRSGGHAQLFLRVCLARSDALAAYRKTFGRGS